MKTYIRHIVVCLLGAGLSLLSGCGESEPTPSPAPTSKKKSSGEPSAKSAAGAKTTSAAGWGDLKGRFVFDGSAPAPAALPITVDQAFCADKMVKDESLLVDAKGGLANVVLFLRTRNVPVHEGWKKTDADEVPFANEACRFRPHIQLLRPAQTLNLLNNDPVEHNTKFEHPDGGNDNMAGNSKRPKKLESETRLPSTVRCNKHPWMVGYILVRESPYMAVSKADGTFEIKDLPAGVDLEFQAWHERSLAENNLLVLPGWDQGRFKVTIEAGKPKDMEDIKVPAPLLVKGN